MTPNREKYIRERFFSKIQKDGPIIYLKLGKCWVWTRGKNQGGYGNFWFRGKTWQSHRVTWVFSNGEIPTGLCVLHKCDNRACVNPEHLFLGTLDDNNKDRTRKGRTISLTAQRLKNLTACKRGHIFNDRNTYTQKVALSDGTLGKRRSCRTCANIRDRIKYEQNKIRNS